MSGHTGRAEGLPTTRAATVVDAPLVARLLHAFNREFDSPTPPTGVLTDRFRGLLGRDDVVVELAIEAGEVRGFAFLTLRPTPYHKGSLAQLEELYVRPDRRARGIGTALLTAAVDRVTAKGAQEVHITVDEPDRDARRFYERHGFGNVQPGTDERMLCYLREL